MKSYKTLMRGGEAEFTVSKSRFIAQGAPCSTERDALGFLAACREKRKDASHHCYCYILGPNMGIMRYSDDGEPGGTAGLPIIETVKARGVTDACVVVTRYFGGVLLGAGGLARAYARGASEALEACGVGEMHLSALYAFDVPYPMYGKIERALMSMPVSGVEAGFSEHVTVSLWVRAADEAEIAAQIVSLSEGRVEPLRLEETYRAWDAQD